MQINADLGRSLKLRLFFCKNAQPQGQNRAQRESIEADEPDCARFFRRLPQVSANSTAFPQKIFWQRLRASSHTCRVGGTTGCDSADARWPSGAESDGG